MDVAFEAVTATEEAILEALACYRYLTAAQLQRLGVTSDSSHLYQTLAQLEGGTVPRKLKGPRRHKKPAIVKRDFGSLPGRGRLPCLYALTEHGAELLYERKHTDPIQIIKRPRIFNNDYFHRIGCVDFHIAVRLWAAQERMVVDFFDTYYDPMPGGARGGRARQKTQVTLEGGVLVPDAVFAFSDEEGQQRLCAFELYCGRRTDRVTKQLAAYQAALDQVAIEQANGYSHNARVLAVFDDPDGMRLVQERGKRDGTLAPHQDFFFLKTLDEVQRDFQKGWQRISGEDTALF